jgi:hypothetical protein
MAIKEPMVNICFFIRLELNAAIFGFEPAGHCEANRLQLAAS